MARTHAVAGRMRTEQHTRRRVTPLARALAISWIGLGTGMALGMVQPEPDTLSSKTTPETPGPNESSALRDRLERVIERSEAMLARHREALKRLDAGESPAQVLRTLRLRDFDRDNSDRAAGRERSGPDGPDGRPVRPVHEGADGDRSGAGQPHENIDPRMRHRLREFLAAKLPSVSEQLAQVETVDAELGARLFDRLAPQLREVVMTIDRDPALGALKLDELRAGLAVVDATQRVRSLNTGTADAASVEEAHEQLRIAIEARFDARIRLRVHELERLAEQITALHGQIQREREGRDAEIDRVYDAVTSQRWGRGAGRPASRPAGPSPDRPDLPADE